MSENAKKTNEMYEAYGFKAAGVPEVDAATLRSWLEQGDGKAPTLVDVRLAAEREVSTLPGAVAKEDFDASTCERGQRVVAYCTIGKRSGDYVKALRKSHPSVDAYNLKGSILAWTQVGGELVSGRDGKTPTNKVHTFGKQWNLPGEGFEGVTFDKTPWGKLVTDKVKGWFGR
jgi:rhodanese-related sulfurtransferase